MIMFLFLLIIFINIIFALPMAKKLLITDVYNEGTTIVPRNMIDNILLTNIKKSSDHLYKDVNVLQSAIKILFPKNDQYEKNFTTDRQSLLIGCLIKKTESSEEQRRACKRLQEKNDKNIYYEFDDKSLEQKNTTDNNDLLPIYIEHINVAKVENNKDKPFNDTVEEIQKLIDIENRFINNETNRERMNLDSIFDFASNRNLINQSTLSNGNRSGNDINRGLFLWPSNNNNTIDKTMKQVPYYNTTHSINRLTDNNDEQYFNTNGIFSRFDKKKYLLDKDQKPLSRLDENNNNDNYTKLNINMKNKTNIAFLTNNTHEKLEQTNRTSNESNTGIWNIGRFSNDSIPKDVLFYDLTKALGTLETIANGKGVDTTGDKISFKPLDLPSIIKSRKYSWKFLQFLNTIKNTIEQLNMNNETNLIN